MGCGVERGFRCFERAPERTAATGVVLVVLAQACDADCRCCLAFWQVTVWSMARARDLGGRNGSQEEGELKATWSMCGQACVSMLTSGSGLVWGLVFGGQGALLRTVGMLPGAVLHLLRCCLQRRRNATCVARVFYGSSSTAAGWCCPPAKKAGDGTVFLGSYTSL